MTDIATLGIRVDSKQAVSAKDALEDLTQAGAETESAIKRVGDTSSKAGDSISKVGTTSRKAADDVNALSSAGSKTQDSIGKIGATSRTAADSISQAGTSAKQTAEALQPLPAQFDSVSRSLDGIGGGGAASIDRVGTSARKSKGDVDGLAASSRNAGAAMDGIAAKSAKASQDFDRVGISAKQTAAALRGVPAQFTDIFVSLSAGQAPLQVLLQQGGQLKDMFGGIGPAAKALGGYIKGLINPYTIAAAAAVSLAVAFQQGSKESYEYQKALILTGNAAGTTADKLAYMAEQLDDVSGTQRAAAAALSQVAGTGKFTAEQIELIGTAAVLMKNNVGVAVDDTVRQFEKLADAPAKASAELNQQYNFLTAAIYEQIAALEVQGDKAGAAQLAIETFANAMAQRSKDVRSNLGIIERAWGGITSAAAEAWDAMLNVGRDDTLGSQLDEAKAKLEDLKASSKNYDFYGVSKQTQIDIAQREVEMLEGRKRAQEEEAKREGEQRKIQADGIAAENAIAKIREQSLSNSEKKEKEIAEYRKNLEKVRAANPESAALAPDRVAADEANIADKYKERAKAISEEERAAKRLQETYKGRIAQYSQEVALSGKATEADRVRYEVSKGGLAGLDEAQKKNLVNLAAQIDATEKLAEANKAFEGQAEQYDRQISLSGELSEVEKLRYETSKGGLKDLNEKQKQSLENQARNIDLANEQKKQSEDLADVIASLRTEEESAEEAAEKMYETLNKAFEAGKISAEEYADASKRIQEGLDEVSERARKNSDDMSVYAEQAARNMQSAFADFLFDPFKDGLDGLLDNFGKILQRMAAEAAAAQIFESIGGWGSANSEAGGFMGAIAGVAANFDGGGFTGAGPRSGGMDGKGGFMAMVHPNETIIDHSKGQSVGGMNFDGANFNFHMAQGDARSGMEAGGAFMRSVSRLVAASQRHA
jgi:phage-related minor tail protein